MLDRDGGLLRGTLDVLILKALSWGPRHGYAVAEWINVVTDGDLLVEEGPLYTARAAIAREVGDELTCCLEMRTQRLVALGMAPDAAHRETLRQFGSVASVREDCVVMGEQRERSVSRSNFIGELHQDVAYAVRTLRRNAGFTALIVGALALGIGANTAIFSLIDAVVVRTLPVAHPEQLVAIGDPARVGSFSSGTPRTDLVSTPLYKAIRDNARAFSGVLASGRPGRIEAHIDGTTGEAERPRARYVSANDFAVPGVPAQAGRVLLPSEGDTPGAAPVITISEADWTNRFHNDPATVGVTPPSFTGDIVGASPDFWIPLSMHDVLHPNQRVDGDYTSSWLLLLGRLEPGASLARAKQEIPALIARTISTNLPGQAGADFLASAPQS